MLKQQKQKNGGVKITFSLALEHVPESTSVVGNFNNWDPLSHPLKKRSNGTRSASVEVNDGDVVEFRYLNERGEWSNDPDLGTNEAGNSVLSL